MNYFVSMDTVCKDLEIDFNQEKYDKFIKYKDMLKLWNEKINLTAIIDDQDIIKKHFIDSINIFKFSPLKSVKSIIDVGTGAGFPGIPIKIIRPEVKLVLLDSLNKRINFLNQLVLNIKLDNIKCIHGRAEDFARKIEYRENSDAVVSRAVANLTVLSELCIPYVKIGGYFIAMKGPSVENEIKESRNAVNILGGKIQDIIKIEDNEFNHNLVVMKKVKHTPDKYPRKAGILSKNPLM